MEVRDLPNRELKIIVIKLFTEIKGTMHEQSDNSQRDIKYLKKKRKKSQG